MGNPQRGAEWFAEGHIPGAQFVGVDTDLSGRKTGGNGRHPLPEPGEFTAFLSRSGVTASAQVVAYDQVGGQYAARLWWMCRWIGWGNVRVLDGGWPKWVNEGLEVSKKTVEPNCVAGVVEVSVDPTQVVMGDEVVANFKSAERLVVDARSPSRFRGDEEPIDPMAGHIPGAVNRFFQDNLRPNGAFRDAQTLRGEFEAVLDGRDSREVVHQCGSGITACANFLAMDYAGLLGSKRYAGSWSEWVADPTRPVDVG
ncbi:MAG: sulfurtransferase [Candidatus Synoicihabitans palmerolidicus]|nr:sulfurtransferase [Candidatus Synoicihabitans palmerolidicus]